MQPRARGAVSLSVRSGGRGTVLARLRQSGSLKALFPRPSGTGLQAVLINTGGGVTGGDRFRVEAHAGAGTELTLTTQAAERAYRAQPGLTGSIATAITVDAGARVNWLPQETILYDGAALNRSLTVDMAEDAALLLVEPLVFGRTAMGESLRDAQFIDHIEIRGPAAPLYLDRLRLAGDIAGHLGRRAVAGSANAMATLVYVAPDAGARLAPLRALLPATAGASLIRETLLCIRILAPDSFVLRQSLIPILNRLTGDDLPRTWTI